MTRAGVPAAGAVLSARGLAVSPVAGGPVVLAEVDLELAPGECVALVGPSGSGKTTLLRTLGGQVAPAAGAVRVGGHDLARAKGAEARALRRRIGLIAQKHDLIETLPVHANVMAGALGRWSDLRALRYLVRPRRAELAEAEAALAQVGLAGKLRARACDLSGGEQQRVAIARALVQGPEVLLADEPVASLDPQTARQVLELLTGVARREGMALVCCLHQPELVERYFDRVFAVAHGRLAKAGRTAVAARVGG